ncbi:N-acetylmuramoyl-L-alanine amidase [Nocardia spumae]|uniref:N-acetylmuramoyl-L-alanine amidase n=1 Tax=Nocardia spumae TaxID=2887190 RepID=UPI0035569A52
MNHPRIIKTGLGLAVATVTTAGLLVPTAAFAAPAAPAPADPDMSTRLAGKTVFLDPGHQGAGDPGDLNRQVDNGRGGTKECQTTGMISRNGVPEHTINWNVAQLVRQSLEALGAQVVLSRQDDTGWGGCVDERAAAANRSGAAVAVSIHADGAPEQDHGFHLIVPQLPIPDAAANQAQSGPGQVATKAVRDAYVQAGFTPANYAGAVDGLQTRSDIAGPALTQVPDVFIEMGNGANVDDAKMLESPDGQLEHAIAITTGLVSYLIGAAPGAPSPAPVPSDSPANVPQSAPAEQSPAAPGATAPNATWPGATAPTAVPGNPAPPGAAQQNSTAPQQNSATDALRGAPRAVPAEPAPGATQAAPGTSAAPGAAQPGIAGSNPASSPPGTYQTAPGTYSTTDPGTSGAAPQQPANPGTSAQALPGQAGTQQSKPGSGSAANGLTGTAMRFLLPLAKSLGMDDSALDSELINLAYTLVSTLMGSSK